MQRSGMCLHLGACTTRSISVVVMEWWMCLPWAACTRLTSQHATEWYVSAFRGVHHTLNLSGSNGVVDVSALGGVHTLDLAYCEGVMDVSALGGVTRSSSIIAWEWWMCLR
eukprot:Opistho-2@10420